MIGLEIAVNETTDKTGLSYAGVTDEDELKGVVKTSLGHFEIIIVHDVLIFFALIRFVLC